MNRSAFFAVAIMASAVTASGQLGRPQDGSLRRRSRLQVPALLNKAIQAQPYLKYTGTYTTEFRQAADSNRHQEYITRDGQWYRIDFPPDSKFAGQVIVENDVVRYHYRPIPNEIIQQPPRHDAAWERVANLANNKRFELSTAPGDVVAGFKTDQLVVSDKSGNVLQRLFIEPGSGVILKREIFDLVGTQIGFFEFNEINLNAKIEPSIFTIKRKGAKTITPRVQLERISRRKGFSLRFIPPGSGFQLEGANAKQFAGVDGLVETYLSGRIRLWVYVLKAPVNPERLRQNAGPNQHTYSFQSNGETVVLLGPIDEKELMRLASMMAPAAGTSGPRH